MPDGSKLPTRFDKLCEGLSIFARYPEPSVDAQHDIIYAGGGGSVTPEDEKRLIELGWSSEEEQYWGFFT